MRRAVVLGAAFVILTVAVGTGLTRSADRFALDHLQPLAARSRALRSATAPYNPAAMPLRKRPDQPRSRVRPEPPKVAVGDRVRIVSRTSPKVGETGGVTHVAGRSVVIELDRPYMAAGTPQRLYYSYPGELELIPRVGRMGAVDLFLDEEDAIDDGEPTRPA
jgi:hypothetical protein